MALEYDGQRIGAMQYNGVTIGEAMIDGQIVYRSVIRVTPVAPTFHDGTFTVTLPEMEGVTYTISGEPGQSATITVTASALPGYELVGDTEWVHTFPTIEPVSGDYSGTVPRSGILVASHTIEHTYEYAIEHSMSGAGTFNSGVADIRINDVIVASGEQGQHSTATHTATVQSKDTVQFWSRGAVTNINASGSWSITPTGASVIRVTPVAPTFHDGEPWITLPTVEGVTYSVSGTPGYDASVTVTATAQPGYELVGTASWSHTFGPPPRYVASDSGGGGNLVRHDWNVIATHTVAYSAPGGGAWQVTWSSLQTGNYGVRVLLNGSQIAYTEENNRNTPNPQSVTIASRQLNTGDTLSFEARSTALASSNRAMSSWSWSLS